MTAWHIAGSLVQLTTQVDALFPNRSTVSDGAIGDAAHASRDSDHNPWYGAPKNPTVTAKDLTNDPDGGMPGQWLADALVRSGDKRIKYIIWNKRIWTPGVGWRPYTGINAHTHHVHVSVVASPLCESRAAWALGAAPAERPSAPSVGSSAPLAPTPLPTLQKGSTGPAVAALQTYLRTHYSYAAALPSTGVYLAMTVAAITEFQKRVGITADGICGPVTNGYLWRYGYRGV